MQKMRVIFRENAAAMTVQMIGKRHSDIVVRLYALRQGI
jgi:hypothetical protein